MSYRNFLKIFFFGIDIYSFSNTEYKSGVPEYALRYQTELSLYFSLTCSTMGEGPESSTQKSSITLVRLKTVEEKQEMVQLVYKWTFKQKCAVGIAKK